MQVWPRCNISCSKKAQTMNFWPYTSQKSKGKHNKIVQRHHKHASLHKFLQNHWRCKYGLDRQFLAPKRPESTIFGLGQTLQKKKSMGCLYEGNTYVHAQQSPSGSNQDAIMAQIDYFRLQRGPNKQFSTPNKLDDKQIAWGISKKAPNLCKLIKVHLEMFKTQAQPRLTT